MKIEVETHIAALPDIVCATVTDIARWPGFVRSIERLELLTPGPIAVGTRFRETRTLFGRSASEEMTVAALDPPCRFDLTAENHGTRYVASHVIAEAPGGSHLRLTFSGTPVTFAARMGAVIALLFKGTMAKQLRADLDDVKAEAERRTGQSPPR